MPRVNLDAYIEIRPGVFVYGFPLKTITRPLGGIWAYFPLNLVILKNQARYIDFTEELRNDLPEWITKMIETGTVDTSKYLVDVYDNVFIQVDLKKLALSPPPRLYECSHIIKVNKQAEEPKYLHYLYYYGKGSN